MNIPYEFKQETRAVPKFVSDPDDSGYCWIRFTANGITWIPKHPPAPQIPDYVKIK
jgi:hypothetical protein